MRGYTLNRGKGQTKRMPKRAECPDCHKRGLGPWKYEPLTNTHLRECRYCRRIEVSGSKQTA